MKTSKLKLSTIALGVTALVHCTQTLAQYVDYAYTAGTANYATTAGAAPAGTLTGATLAPNVTASSLTSVGTLTGLNVNGTTNLTNVTSISGTNTLSGTNSMSGNNAISGTTNIGGVGSTTSISGSNTMSGTNGLSGTTSITGNNAISGTTNIGGVGSTTNISGSNTMSGTNGLSGTTSISGTNSMSGTNSISGTNSVSGTNNISGTNTMTGTNNLSGPTTINTGASTDPTTIGAAGNQTFLNSARNEIGNSSGYATVNNMGAGAAFQSTNAIGNSNAGSTVSAVGGAGSLTLNNSSSTMATANNGGMVQTNANSATIRASNTGTLASNGSTGVMAIGAGGGYTAYATQQNTGAMNSIGNVVDNKTYTNKISGNTFIDGNVYINGTLDYVSSNSANTTVISAGTSGSVLRNASTTVQAGTAIVMKGATGTQTVVDSNGKLSNVTGTAAQSTASLTLTNGIGNTHGLVVTEAQATLSGGTRSSSLTMSDNGATFSDAQNGSPVQVHGVNDGTADFDAVNVRQFAGAISSVTAMANIPQVDQDKSFSLGVGVGGFHGQSALAAGMSYRFTRNGVFKASVSSAMTHSDTDTLGLGVAWSY